MLATLIRIPGNINAAAKSLQDASAAAPERWPAPSVQAEPPNWLILSGRYRSIDRFRRTARFDASRVGLARKHFADLAADADLALAPALVNDTLTDDQLRLVFTCCYPARSPDAQIALTVREV